MTGAGGRKDPEKRKLQVQRANQARYRARMRLQKLHPEDWARLLAEECAVEGITPVGPNRRTDPDRAAQAKVREQTREQARIQREQNRRDRDLTGRVLGRWTVLERGPNSAPTSSQPSGVTQWRCRCACGTERLVRRHALVSGTTRSCGCLQRELTSARSTQSAAPGDAA